MSMAKPWRQALMEARHEIEKAMTMPADDTFVQSVNAGRKKAVSSFLKESGMSRSRWNDMQWNEWHTQPELAEFNLQPLGGRIRFPGHELEQIVFAFANVRPVRLFGVTIDVDANRIWNGAASNVNDAAREAITGLLELAWLRSTQKGEAV